MQIKFEHSTKTLWTDFLIEFPQDLQLPYDEIVFMPAPFAKNFKFKVVTTGPKAEFDDYKTVMENAARNAVNTTRSNVQGNIKKVLKKVFEEKISESKGESKKAFANAKKAVDDLNKYLETQYMNMLGHVVREMAEELGKRPKEIDCRISEKVFEGVKLKLFGNAFDSSFTIEDAADFSDIKKALDYKNKWQFCGIVAKGTMAFVAASKEKPIKASELKGLEKTLGGAGVKREGVVRFTNTTADFIFVKSTGKIPKETIVRAGLNVQAAEPSELEDGKDPPGKFSKITIWPNQLAKMPGKDELSKVEELHNSGGGG